jgi:alkanesulfonate monooxygenase SsuD/methylene tetrahydromethanopterin reductase-like flavin-dependent oxidoreductase (luciferase family)
LAEFRFGILAPQIVPYDVQVQRWKELDASAFDSLWLADLFANAYMPSGRWFEAYTLMAAAAVQTTRIRLGAMVTSITLRQPALFAKEALTVDHVSNGRLEIALGSAGPPSDVSMTGLPDWSRGERTKRFVEFTEMLDTLLRNEVASYDGEYYHAREAVMNPGPLQQPRPPLTLAAHGPRTMRLAARLADGWNQVPGSHAIVGEDAPGAQEALESVRTRNRQMDEFCAEAGREPSTLRRSITAGTSITPEPIWSSTEAFEDFVGRYREAGVNEFVFYYPSRVEKAEGAWERIAHETVARLKAASD